MKTICSKINNKSIYLLEDHITIENSEKIIYIKDGDKIILAISDPDKYSVYENVEDPEYWSSGKYRYTKKYGWHTIADFYDNNEKLFSCLHGKILQLVQCLYEKDKLSDDEYNLLSEDKSIKESIKEYIEKCKK
jgi:hypothetical protein